MTTYRIVALPGDGIGSEILNGSLELLEIVSKKYSFTYNSKGYDFGGAAIDTHGTPLPNETLSAYQEANVVLSRAVEGPRWTDPNNCPEQGLLALHKKLGLFASARPAKVTEDTSQFSPLKEARVRHTDLVIARGLMSGIYFSEPGHISHSEALDSLIYTKAGIGRTAKVTSELAHTRNKKVTSVNRENVLASGKLWRRTVTEISKSYPDIELNHLLVDACSMHPTTHPSQLDIIVTENLFGDVLSDEASVIPGSFGLSPSVSLSERGTRFYKPIRGSAPDIANQNLVNPSGVILSLVMCLRESLNQSVAAEELEDVVYHLTKAGKTTENLGGHYKTSETFELPKKNYQ